MGWVINTREAVITSYSIHYTKLYDMRFAAWRKRLQAVIKGERALEVGVGTGKNLTYYPGDVHITAIDLSPQMLARARKKAEKLHLQVDLQEMDVQHLKFPDHAFDTVFATFVFCSVPDPVAGLRELKRVCKPDGRLLLLEHMRPGNPVFGRITSYNVCYTKLLRISNAKTNKDTSIQRPLLMWANRP